MITQLQQLRRTATVNSVTPPTANVYIGGDPSQDFDLPYVNQPRAGDTVLLSGNQGDYIIVGPIFLPLTVWSPTPANLTVGNGTVTAQYTVLGNLMFLTYSLIFGSSTAISGLVTWPIPAGYTAAAGQDIMMRLGSSANTVQWLGLVDIATGATTLNPWLPTAAADTRLSRLGSFGLTMGAASFIRFTGWLVIQ